MSLRTQIVQKLVHINESIFFYPKLKRFYTDNLKNKQVNILDVGANKGQSIDFFLKINSNTEFDAFEPNKKLFTFLQNKYKTNTKQIQNKYKTNTKQIQNKYKTLDYIILVLVI